MEYEATKTRPLNIAFLLDSEALKRLENILSEVKGESEYQVKFSDGSTVKYHELDEVISQPNAPDKRILSIVASKDNQHGQSAFVTMRDDPEPSIEYTVNGPQHRVIYFSQKLDEWAASTKRWYSGRFSQGFGAGLLVAVVAMPLYLSDRISQVFPAKNPGIMGWIPFTTIVLVSLMEYFIIKLLPRGTFAIGHGATRMEQNNWILGTLFVGFFLAIISSIFAAWIAHRFFQL